MATDWNRRRVNIRILMAAQGTNATAVAEAAGLSPNTLSQFTSGRTKHLTEKSLEKILPVLGLAHSDELDTDNPLSDPRIAIKRLLDAVPDGDLPGLLRELQIRFPVKR